MLQRHLLEERRAADTSSRTIELLQEQMAHAADLQVGNASEVKERAATLTALYAERVALHGQLATAQRLADGALVWCMQAKAAQLLHSWMQRYVPDDWLGRDQEAAWLLTLLLRLCHGLQLLQKHALGRARAASTSTAAQCEGDVAVDAGAAGLAGAGGGEEGGKEAESMGSLAAVARAVFVGVWRLDGLCQACQAASHGLSAGPGQGETGQEAEGPGPTDDAASRSLGVVCGYTKDVAELVAAVERLVTAGQRMAGNAGEGGSFEVTRVMETAGQTLDQLYAHVKSGEASEALMKNSDKSDGALALQEAIDGFVNDTSPGFGARLDGWQGHGAGQGLLALPAGMARRAEKAKARLEHFATVEGELQQCRKDLWGNALALRERSLEIEALRHQVQMLAAQERRGDGGEGELRKLQEELDRYKREAEETISTLIEKEDRLRQQLQLAHGGGRAGMGADGAGIGGMAGSGGVDGESAHAGLRSGGDNRRKGWADGCGDAEGLRAHVAAMRHSVGVLRSRQARAAMLQELPPLELGVGSQAGRREWAGGVSEAPFAVSLRSVGAAPGAVASAAGAGGGEGGGSWEDERGRRVEVVACRKEVARLQQLMLKASVAPRVVSLTSEGTGQREGASVRRQFAEVSSCLRSIARASNGLQCVV